MDIDARKEKREKAQSENLLSIIRKEISPNVYTFPERKKNDRPDIVLAISGKRIGIEVTECYPSNHIDEEDKKKGKRPLYKKKNYTWLMKECEDFKNSPYFVNLTKDQHYKIKIYTTNAVYRGKHHDEFQNELIEHIEAIRYKRYPISTKLISRIKVEPSVHNYVDFFHTSSPWPVKWEDVLREIEKKEEQSVEYEHTDELWLNIYIPWVENIVSYEMDIGKNDIATIRERLLQSKFQRIYLSSIREHDTFVLKTNNGKDMLDEEHCISTIDVS